MSDQLAEAKRRLLITLGFLVLLLAGAALATWGPNVSAQLFGAGVMGFVAGRFSKEEES